MTNSEQAIENVIVNLCQRILELPNGYANVRGSTHERIITTHTQTILTLCEAKRCLADKQDSPSNKLDSAEELAERVAMENFRNLANL